MLELTPFGKLFSQSWELYKKRLTVLATLYVLPFLASVVSALATADKTKNSTNALSSVNPATWVAAGVAAIVVGLIYIVVSLWIQIASVHAITGSEDKPKVGELLSKSWPLVLPLLLVAILSALAVVGGLILLVIPGIIFAVWFSFANFTLILEGKRGTEALKSSKALVTGRWGAVFGRFLLLLLCFIGVSIVIGIIMGIVPGMQTTAQIVEGGKTITKTIPTAAGNIVNSAISSFLLAPVGLIFTYLLYKDLKRKPAATAPKA